MVIPSPRMNFVTEAAPSSSPVGVQNDLGWALATLFRGYLRAADGVLAGVPGGARGYRVLTSVARDCPASQLALAQLIGLDRTVVTYLLDDLVAAGMVERTADPADRRARRVVATPTGRARLTQADHDLRGVEGHLLGGLTSAEVDDFRSMLAHCAMRISTDTGDVCTAIEDIKSGG